MSRISVGHTHRRPSSGEKTLRRCRNNEEADEDDDVILIDVDSESFDNVIIIDISESLPEEEQRSHVVRKDKKSCNRNVIYIDDDENPESNHSFGVNNAGTSSNRESSRVAKNFPDSAYADFGECEYSQDTSTPVRLSKKGKRINSGKASTRNCYGLNIESENDSSDDDYPDCEVVEDSAKVQELWEKAYSRRKKDFENGHSDIGDHDSYSRVFDRVYCRNFEEDAIRQRTKVSSGLSTGKFDNEKDDDQSCSQVNFSRSRPGDDEKTAATGNVREHERLKSGKSHASGGGEEMENLMPRRCSFKKSALPHKQTDHSSTPVSEAIGSVSGKSSRSKGNLGSGDNVEKDYRQEEEEDKDGQLHSPNGETSPLVGDCIINEREKLKKTDEYKRAMEEEWASRQQALQIQAEEAQRLRRLEKRKKAESMRLLDMEKRQKQRVEEMRDIQKKDEENMNMKEIVRAEVRKELKKLEVSCHNMASLLHLLGIRVGGWPTPMPQEVQSAYKRALLTFHPDRTSQSDIRLQVEAEEKFKLINRLKEKYSPSL